MIDDIRGSGASVPTRIGSLLVVAGKLSPTDAERVGEAQLHRGLPFGETAVALGLINQDDLDAVLAGQFGLTHMSDTQLARFDPELVSLHQPMGPRADALRRLRNEVLAAWGPGRLEAQAHGLAVISAEADAGSSWLAANLAVVFAQAQIRTGLVDFNFRQPGLHRKFDLPLHPGLSNQLASGSAGTTPWHEVGGVPHLSVLCAGAQPPAPEQLLSSHNLASLAQHWRHRFDLLLLDLPPAGQHADALNVIRLFGAQALVVARRDHSPKKALGRLYAELNRARVNVVATLMME